jgi:hypothetical protein
MRATTFLHSSHVAGGHATGALASLNHDGEAGARTRSDTWFPWWPLRTYRAVCPV